MEPTSIAYDLCRCYVADNAFSLGPTITNRILGFIRSKSLRRLCEVSSSFDPASHDHNTLRVLLQIEAFFKKNDSFVQQDVCKKAAIDSFRESEEICRLTNLRLDDYFSGDFPLVRRMQAFIKRVLGGRNAFLDMLPCLVRLTNGATATRSRLHSSHVQRVSSRPYATSRSHKYLESLGKWWGYTVKCRPIEYNRVELVPKNWKTHRSIACEPEGNVFLQLAFDTYCKRRLKSKINLDLSDQSRNQELARLGSINGILATIDLKAASDRLSLNVVHLLFEREWVDFFLDTRSPNWKDDSGVLHGYHKLSSMGNGFTFAIETLVFAAACWAVGSELYSVYGDDIIIESCLVSELISLLAYLGFEVNQSKTHSTGLYRESCGHHYYGGFYITPLFIRSEKNKMDIVKLVNDILHHTPFPGQCWKFAKKILSSHNLPLCPENSNPCSGVFIDVRSAYREKLIRTRHSITRFRSLIPKSRTLVCYDSRALFMWHLCHTDEVYESSRYSLGTHKYRSKWVCYQPIATGGSDQIYIWSEYILGGNP